MKTRLSQEKLKLFLEDKLSGDESVEILLHLDEVDTYHWLVPKEDPMEVLERLLANDDEIGITEDGDGKIDSGLAL